MNKFMNNGWLVLPAVLSIFTAAHAAAPSFSDGYRLIESIAAPAQGVLETQPLNEVLKPGQSITDQAGNTVVTYQKFVGNRPVFGETAVVVFPKNGTPFTVQGADATRQQVAELAKATERAPVASVTVEAAERVATADIRKNGAFVDATVPAAWLKDPEVVMYRDAAGALHLCHHLTMPVREQGVPTTRDVFVDAENGSIVDAYSRLFDLNRGEDVTTGTGLGLHDDTVKTFPVAAEAGQYKLFDAARNIAISSVDLDKPSLDADHNWDHVGTTRADNQRAEVELYLNFQKIVDFYKTRFGFVWNGTVAAVAHVNNPQTGEGNFNNAFFHPWYNAFFFGDGSLGDNGFDYLGKAVDVAGHEFGHGMIDKEGPLAYSGESGALNEHIADLMGACIDDKDWLMGEEITCGTSAGKGLRNMQDPANGHAELLPAGTTYAKWREINRPRPIGDRIYPTTIATKLVCTASEDNGGVHLNSSIFNRFAYLASSGDGLGSEGLGRQRLADVYVKAMRAHLYGQKATFAEMKTALLAAAKLQLDGDPKKDVYIATMNAAFTKIGL